MKKISLVIPFFNEASGVMGFFEALNAALSPLSQNFYFEYVSVNDGSRDNTFAALIEAKKRFQSIRIIDLSRNFGKESAITAGIDIATGEAVIPIDGDLQHPPEVILELITKWEEGFDVVLARRIDRSTDKTLQKYAAKSFYEMSRHITHVEIPPDVGDFRLMDRKVVEAVKSLRESCRFMKGIFAWVGFKTAIVDYKVNPRVAGKSSFNTWKLWNFALEGVTSFSTVPLRIWSYIGGVVAFFAILYGAYLSIKVLLLGIDVPGYTSLMVTILLSCGIQLIGIGVLGEYVGRIFSEVKQRPLYIVREIIE